MTEISFKERILGGLWGAVIGDALGVPVEFKSREVRKMDPVTGMRGYGTFNLPPGSWSDDSSLMLCTTESLLDGFDTNRMGQLFIQWLNEAYWTPWGETFDVGGATHAGIKRMMRGIPPEEAGGTSDGDNGNGSLMHILPVGLYFANSPVSEILEYAHRASSLTHRHVRSQIACGFYCLMVSALLKGNDPEEAYHYAIVQTEEYYNQPQCFRELAHFERILSGNIHQLPEEKIQSGGYVIHTLEASIWCLLNSHTFTEAVLKAVNLGDDTDTTGIVTGGLAGIYYGVEAIPKEWVNVIARKEDIDRLFNNFMNVLK
ncbi:MAG: ADP-ribosylglycohydrolase family protein [Proteobacteria bacterium]|nr:ADP-ribosylglycohydrolase family protein [Pseudomonadota bacterium]